MADRTFYKTTYTVEILSEDPIPDELDLKDVLKEAEIESYSGDIKSVITEQVDCWTMIKLLKGQRSDPAFFHLDDLIWREHRPRVKG